MNETYLILGASSEVGMEYIKQLNDKSSLESKSVRTVIAHYRNLSEELKQLADTSEHIRVELIQCDLSKVEKVQEMLDEIEKTYGYPTHILHLPASKLQYGKLKNLQWDMIENDFKIQIQSLMLILQRFLPHMAKQQFGKVVIMLSSVTLGMPPKYMTGYAMVKYALLGFMKSIALEYADKNITINGISPSMMKTKFLNDIDDKIVELSALQSVKKKNIMVQEVAGTIHYLFSDASSYMCGVNINLSGGEY